MYKALGIDISTQSVTAIVLDPIAGELCCKEQVFFGSDFPGRGHPEGFIKNDCYELDHDEVHADPLLWLDAIEMVFDRLSKSTDLSRIQSVAVSGQQHGSIYLMKGFVDAISDLDFDKPMSQKIAPFLSRRTSPIWMDNSTSEECSEISFTLGGDMNLCRITGSVATCRFTGPQIRKFAKRNAVNWTLTHRIHLVSSFVTSVLAGVDCPIDVGDAAGMNLMNINTYDWSLEALAATADDLCSKLPRICSKTSIVGSISSYFSGRYGFSTSCKVVLGTGDNPSSLIGVGGVQSGTHVLSLGTSDTLFSTMDRVCTDPEGFGNVFGNPVGGYLSLLCFRNGALARDVVRRESACDDWSEFSAAIASSPPAVNVCLPIEVDEITPKRQKGRIYACSTPQSFELPRASVEGQILNIKIHSKWINCIAKKIILTGGASQSDPIAQIVSDIFGLPVYRIVVSDSAALGAAMRAAHTGLGFSLANLVEQFCAPLSEVIMPNLDLASSYASLEDKLKTALLKPKRLCLHEKLKLKYGLLYPMTVSLKKEIADCLTVMKMVEHDGNLIQIPQASYLFIGSIGAAYNKVELDKQKITHVVCATPVAKLQFESTLTYLRIKLNDSLLEDITPHISNCIHFIETASAAGGKILIHCFQGKSRSVAFVCAYLMFKFNLSYDRALQIVRSVRPQAQPNIAFEKQVILHFTN